jgi:hypothetical protein
MKYFMNAIALGTALVVWPAHAARHRAVAVPSPALSIQFVDVATEGAVFMAAGSDAWIDTDAMSKRAGSTGQSMRVRSRFGVRILRAGAMSWGTATVTARLNSPDGRSSITIDGQRLGNMAIVVSPRAAVGTVTIHTIEIEVSDSVAEGPLSASIHWEVTAQ